MSRAADQVPACYAMTVPGLEAVAAEELVAHGAEIKKTSPGLLVFRPPEVDRSLLRLRTVEDVYLLLWGTDSLSYRAQDLDRITRWTAQQPQWQQLLQLHHSIRHRAKGKPSYHLVAQMHGEHGYRRTDALKAMARGLAGKLPPSWRLVDEDADLEVWLTIKGASAVCGVRLSDRSMRHRTYKEEHRPASLRPVVAAAMVRLAQMEPNQLMLDPMCGVGTILAERLAVARKSPVLGGDTDVVALRAAQGNLFQLGEHSLSVWDARQLPLANHSIDRLVCNPPFGKQLANPEEIPELYRELVHEWNRIVSPDGRVVLLVSDLEALETATRSCNWKLERKLRLRILGQSVALTVWRRP